MTTPKLADYCRVQQKTGKLEVGDVLCRRGAWQRKYTVTAITPTGYTVDRNGLVDRHHYTVELVYMGDAYATGKVRLAGKGVLPTERVVDLWVGRDGGLSDLSYLDGFTTVMPAKD